ncbi:MAG: hypothetical protein E7439_03350 [Ruminococcaceae bacterium]|nr:hypothetical protein [Oscillospiraceae bacterium]
MANKALKGLTIKIGGDTSDLLKSLDNVDKKSRSLSSELGQINKLLKLDPKNTELLAQKQKVLTDAISNTEKRLGALKAAEKQAQEQFERGEISEEQYRALQREIIATEKKLDGYKNAAREAAEAAEKLADGADEAGKELGKQAGKTREAEDATEDLDDVAGDLAKGGLAALAGAAGAATAAVVALAETTREYRTATNRLDVAYKDSGFSAEAARKTYEELQSVLGETDQAVEAANLLAKFCDTEEELKEMTHALTGVYATFPDSLPIEALAESANETARTGQIAGNLADALNWAAAEGETFGVVMKEAAEENEEWNKAVEEAASVEDYFNLALQECSSEQERQQLITQTLTQLYANAATQYKQTNKEIIRSNQATENWNKTTAELGKTVEPVITDIKELGATLLEDAEEPLKDTAKFIRKDLIPAIREASSWTRQNLPTIKAGLAAVATAMIALKVATAANTVEQKGLKAAIKDTTVAQKALALAQKATPWGLALAAITAVTVALAAYTAATNKAKKPTNALTKAEQNLMAAADEAAAAFRDQKKATDDALADVAAEMKHTEDLADELFRLADASGKVKEEDRERANFILNELNKALDTEYVLLDGVITQYEDLKTNIQEVMQAKLANSLLDAANAEYISAIQNEAAALQNLSLKEKEYRAQLETSNKAREHAKKKWNEYYTALGQYSAADAEGWRVAAMKAEKSANKEESILAEKKTAYETAAADYGTYYSTIANYEEAQAAALSGNYQTAVDILSRKGEVYGQYSDKVDQETARVLNTLYKEAIDAGLEAERIKTNFEKGVDGYTQDMVKEAEKGYENALNEFANAYADAELVGENLGDGLSGGMENKRSGLLTKARSLVSGIIGAMREEADSHSPARKTIDFGEDVGEGAEIGIERKTHDVKRAATDQAAAILDAYSTQERNGQKALRNVADQQSLRQATTQMTAAASNAPMLEKILAAIEKGQIIAIDGEAIVGATASRMDSALGHRRTLASRGAI